jgi:CRISPR-associated protein Csb2
MTVLELSFPAGRYHATPWGRHVNEGAVEWPPSPWRIVRALIATWYLKAREIPEDTVRSLVSALSHPPVFRLPRATTAHTRHYMPYNEGKNERTTKVFDTFIQIAENDSVFVAWDLNLPSEQLDALRKLVKRLGYFGRAEGLVAARVLEAIPEATNRTHSIAAPLSTGTPLPEKTELVRLLAPLTSEQYGTWRTEFLATKAAPTAATKRKRKKIKGDAGNDEPVVPTDLFESLHADTGKLQAAGWNLPPGATFVNYTRREDVFAPATRPLVTRKGPLPTVARYAVVSTVAPRITRAISIGDRVHDTLCNRSDQGKGRATVFTGLDQHGKPSINHEHAHIFCEANGPRDAVTHIIIWAPMGFDEAACLALRRLTKVWGHGGHDIRLVLHGIGQPTDFKECPLLGSAKAWRSLTPFVSTRHAKTFRDGRPKIDDSGWQHGSAPHDLQRLLALNPAWQGAKIRVLEERAQPYAFGERRLRSLQFQTIRHDGAGKRGQNSGAAFLMEFPEPVRGPIALGYGAHFGLGLFVPASL